MIQSRALRVSIVVCASAAIATAMAAPAGAQSRFRVGISGGVAIPTGDFNDHNDPGLSAGAHVLVTSPFFPQNFKLEVQHNRMESSVADTRSMVTSGTFNLEWTFGRARAGIAPYASGGLGAYYIKMPFRGPTAGTTTYSDVTKFGTNAGGGLRFAVPGINLFLDARYHWVRSHGPSFLSKVRYVPVVLGVTL